MKWTILMISLLLGMSNSGKKSNPVAELDGTWVPTSQQIAGKDLPASFFESQKLILADSSYELHAESVDKGVAKYSDGKMDIWGKEGVNQGRHFMAIYRLEGEQLSVCYDLSGTQYPERFETAEHPTYFLSVFKKQE